MPLSNLEGLSKTFQLPFILIHTSIPRDNLLTAFHSIELCSRAICVGSHTSKKHPVVDFHLGRDIGVLGYDVDSITSHAEDGGSC